MTDNELVLQMVIEIDKVIMARQRDQIEELEAQLRAFRPTSMDLARIAFGHRSELLPMLKFKEVESGQTQQDS